MSKGRTDVKFVELHGRTLSQRTTFYENGQIAERGTFGSGPQGWSWSVPIGILEKYFENGQLESKKTYNHNGNLDGEALFYNKTGVLIKKRTYLNDKMVEEITFVEESVVSKT